MQVLGLDIGFGFTKVTDGRSHQIFKSVVGEAAEAAFNNTINPGTGAPLGTHRQITIGDESYFVGETAEAGSRGRGFTLDQQQLLSRYARVLAAAAIAPMAPSGEPLRVVTGLPISFLRRHRDDAGHTLETQGRPQLSNLDGNRCLAMDLVGLPKDGTGMFRLLPLQDPNTGKKQHAGASSPCGLIYVFSHDCQSMTSTSTTFFRPLFHAWIWVFRVRPA